MKMDYKNWASVKTITNGKFGHLDNRICIYKNLLLKLMLIELGWEYNMDIITFNVSVCSIVLCNKMFQEN